MKRNTLESIKISLARNSYFLSPTGCRICTLAGKSKGYPQIRYEGRKVCVHRIAWVLANGPIPDGAFVLHKCDTPTCFEITHLFLGNAKVNALDRQNKGRSNTAYGERHGHAKLTEKQVMEILADQSTRPQIARKFGVATSTIDLIKWRKNWKHL